MNRRQAGRSRKEVASRIRRVLEAEGRNVGENVRPFNEGRYRRYAEMEHTEAYRAEARRIKEDAVDRLPELVEAVREAVRDNGGVVHMAEDADEARACVRAIATSRGARSVVKGKSMTSEEIRVNEALEDAGIDVHETDLAEFVLQLAGEEPSHIAAPAVHKSRAEIAALFNARFDLDEPLETPRQLTRFARDVLLERIEAADVGLTGANFLTADTGTVVLVTNEGNARKCVVTPDTYVVVAGVEKIVPSLADLPPFMSLIAPAGSGQDLTAYVSLFTPPVESPAIDFDAPDEPGFGGAAEREFHLVLVDNGRTALRDDEQLRETLYCIRCGACANSCANFQQVGGHVFGGETYSGGIATGWEAGVHGLASAAEFNDLCTGCTRCVNACPVQIDIPWINTVVRDRIRRGADQGILDVLVDGLTPGGEPAAVDPATMLFGHFDVLAKWASRTGPISNAILESSLVRAALERVAGIDRRRPLPRFAGTTLRKWFAARPARPPAAPLGEVVLFPDLHTNHVHVERGKAAVRVLEALGVDVRVADVSASGRAALSQGMVEAASGHAERVARALSPEIEAGRDVVVIEPSDHAMFRRDYARLLDPPSFERLSGSCFELFEYLDGLLGDGADTGGLPRPSAGDDRVAYHGHCQQRTLGLEGRTISVLERLGFDVATSDVECCGMAGSFGYKTEYYDLSVAVGGELRGQLTSGDRADRRVVASGTSCQEQLEALLARDCVHPIRLLDPGPAAGG